MDQLAEARAALQEAQAAQRQQQSSQGREEEGEEEDEEWLSYSESRSNSRRLPEIQEQ